MRKLICGVAFVMAARLGEMGRSRVARAASAVALWPKSACISHMGASAMEAGVFLALETLRRQRQLPSANDKTASHGPFPSSAWRAPVTASAGKYSSPLPRHLSPSI